MLFGVKSFYLNHIFGVARFGVFWEKGCGDSVQRERVGLFLDNMGVALPHFPLKNFLILTFETLVRMCVQACVCMD